MVPQIMKQGRLVPWLYLSPALFIMLVFIVAPTFNTIVLSFTDKFGTKSVATTCRSGSPCWGILDNYRYALTDPAMLTAFRNNALWLLLMVPGAVAAGLIFVLLVDLQKPVNGVPHLVDP